MYLTTTIYALYKVYQYVDICRYTYDTIYYSIYYTYIGTNYTVKKIKQLI